MMTNGTTTSSGNRLDAPAAGAPEAPRGRGGRKRKPPQPSAAARTKAAAAARAERWAHAYTGVAVGLSAGLNGYAAVQGSETTGLVGQVAAAGIGALIPLMVWGLAKVAAWAHKAGRRQLALLAAAVAACLLALSVLHVAAALAALTGIGGVLAGLQAVGIDCGLVVSEVTAIAVTTTE
jgi:hypothetical protein